MQFLEHKHAVFNFDPSCMHVWSVMYECEKKHNCEVFFCLFFLTPYVFFNGIIVVLLWHEVGILVPVIVLLST